MPTAETMTRPFIPETEAKLRNELRLARERAPKAVEAVFPMSQIEELFDTIDSLRAGHARRAVINTVADGIRHRLEIGALSARQAVDEFERLANELLDKHAI